MNRATKFSRAFAAAGLVGVLALMARPIMTDVAAAPPTSRGGILPRDQIFRPFPDDSGRTQSATAIQSLDGTNKFFEPSLGTNGQACVTCHLPDQGFTLHVDKIQAAFSSSGASDPLFRLNDTADRPDATDPSAPDTCKLFRDMGIIRIGRPVPTTADFKVEGQQSARFGMLPNAGKDPQAPGRTTLSLFRRPLVNTNVRFDSAVLWDGRAGIADMRTQVKNAAKGLLLATAVLDADADDVAAFMLGVVTDQVFDTSAGRMGAGNLAAARATSGVFNLLALASDAAAPCLFAVNNATTPPTLVLTPLTPPTCTPIIPENPHTVTLFDAWANRPNENGVNAGRASIARGQELFNTVDLHVPADIQIPG
jgi:cytochrome c peroxidase